MLLALLAACRASSASSGSSGSARTAPADADTFSANAASFRALQAALSEGEDELAAQIVERLRARPLSGRERALLDSAERVLAGRALVRTLDLALASEPVPGRPERFDLVLVARCTGPKGVHLRLPPCDLKRLRSSMDARGVEGFDYESRASDALRDLALAPFGVERRVALLAYDLPLGRALAARERWRLESRSGEIECDGETYPAAKVAVSSCARERFSPLLAAAPVAGAELARRLEAETAPTQRELLELALRVPEADREDALAAAAPVVTRLARGAPERVAAAEPALRWLTQNRDLGLDAAAWARYLEARRVFGATEDAQPAGNLDLPAPTRAPELGGQR